MDNCGHLISLYQLRYQISVIEGFSLLRQHPNQSDFAVHFLHGSHHALERGADLGGIFYESFLLRSHGSSEGPTWWEYFTSLFYSVHTAPAKDQPGGEKD
jgi:hypothetical protein